ncbi:IPL1 [Candida jiufengensis]|uniref:IPL1 n=1 Tax=Candida jiufengensis TaxID=497108 RepID=UPI002223FDB4|nr:IPL1 [Candida jiufengensis]KAI5956938.1 IPL1 [Candida jiufengensis]
MNTHMLSHNTPFIKNDELKDRKPLSKINNNNEFKINKPKIINTNNQSNQLRKNYKYSQLNDFNQNISPTPFKSNQLSFNQELSNLTPLNNNDNNGITLENSSSPFIESPTDQKRRFNNKSKQQINQQINQQFQINPIEHNNQLHQTNLLQQNNHLHHQNQNQHPHQQPPTILKPLDQPITNNSQTTHSPPLNIPESKFEDFEIGKILGKGKLGKVYCAKHKQSGLPIALKIMSKKELISMKLEKNFKREVEIQSCLYHQNITHLYTWFHDSINVYLVLEFSLYGELYQLLKTKKKFDNILASYYIYQIVQALKYLHSKNIIHRDLKPENIMLNFNNIVKLSDFGWSVYTKTKIEKQEKLLAIGSNKRNTICGTMDYLPPEMIEQKSHDYKVDLWALGILIYEFLIGKPPFEENDKNATYKRILKVDLKFPTTTKLDNDAIDLIFRLLKFNPQERISLDQVLEHPWIIKNSTKWVNLSKNE